MSDQQQGADPAEAVEPTDPADPVEPAEAVEPTGASRTTEARTFVVVVVGSGLVAWQIGFDLGAFDTVDHRWRWTIWVLSFTALVSSLIFRNSEFALRRRWQVVLAIPTLRIISDYFLPYGESVASNVVLLASAATFPLALYTLARLLAGHYFGMRNRIRVAATAMIVAIFLAGLVVGEAHPRYLECEDFERIGDYVPANCSPESVD